MISTIRFLTQVVRSRRVRRDEEGESIRVEIAMYTLRPGFGCRVEVLIVVRLQVRRRLYACAVLWLIQTWFAVNRSAGRRRNRGNVAALLEALAKVAVHIENPISMWVKRTVTILVTRWHSHYKACCVR